MAKLTTGQAAKLYGIGRTTVWKAAKAGQLSYETERRRGRDVMLFDDAELLRFYGEPGKPSVSDETVTEKPSERMALLEKTVENNALHREIELLREQLAETKADRARELGDLRTDRDHWRDQAERVTRQLEDKRAPEKPVKRRGFWHWLTQ